tara:strand:+ start:1292 stop:2683 length:1392 start_codon:yes stop_codon:yes gene_type:complete
MSIKRRRDAVLKSNISINSIRDSVVKFTKGLTAARQTSSEIVKSTDRNNKFKRTLIGNDNTYFTKRRENARRRQREDELEASTVQGTTKRQGNVVSRSTKGFLGRILDFFGIVLIGWFVNTLPKILKSIQALIKRIQGAISILTNFMESIGDFLVAVGTGISGAIQSIKSVVDLVLLRRQNEESLESANNNLNKVRKDMMTTAFAYNNPANAGLKDFSGDQLIESELDEKKDKKEDESPEQEKPKEGDANNIEGEKDNFNVDNTPDSGTEKQQEEDPNDQNLIKGISDDKDFKNLESNKSQDKGETISDRDEANKASKNEQEQAKGIFTSTKNYIANFFGGDGQQQSDNQKRETDNKKDNSSSVSGAVSKIRQIATNANQQVKGEKKKLNIEPSKRERNNMNTKKNKNRSQVVIIEKGVPTGTSSAPSGGSSGGGSSLNSLDGFQDSDAMKKGIKKLQSIILA